MYNPKQIDYPVLDSLILCITHFWIKVQRTIVYEGVKKLEKKKTIYKISVNLKNL